MNPSQSKPHALSLRVEAALDTIRPYLVADGGNVQVLEITERNDLLLEFLGSCRDCPMSNTTFRMGIEQAIRSSVPEINKVDVAPPPQA